VGFISALTCQVHPEPPDAETHERYVTTFPSPSPTILLLPGDHADDTPSLSLQLDTQDE